MKNNKTDLGHQMTDEELAKLERRIYRLYRKSLREMQVKVDAYFDNFRKRDEVEKRRLDEGKITKQEYDQWRLAQMGRGERFEALRDELSERMLKANEAAAAYINDTTPGIYSLNQNYAAYTIEQVSGNVGFTLQDEQTVRRLFVEQPDILPKRRVNAPVDLKWNRTRFGAEITSGILQGESIRQLAKRVENLSMPITKAQFETPGQPSPVRRTQVVKPAMIEPRKWVFRSANGGLPPRMREHEILTEIWMVRLLSWINLSRWPERRSDSQEIQQHGRIWFGTVDARCGLLKRKASRLNQGRWEL